MGKLNYRYMILHQTGAERTKRSSGGSVIITMAHAHKTVPCHPSLNQARFLARERGLFRRIYYSRFLYHDYITGLPIPGHGLRPQNSISCRYRGKLSFVDSDLNSSTQEPTSLNQISPESTRQQTDASLVSLNNLPLRRVILMITYLSTRGGSSEKRKEIGTAANHSLALHHVSANHSDW